MHQQHLFGTLLTAFRQRKPGLSQTRLAELVGYAPAILVRMGQGKKDLTGPSGRERILRIVATLCDEGIRLTVDEVNALLTSANLPPLYDGLPIEAALRRRLQAGGESVPITPRNNLPIQRNVFIGRDNEIASLCERLTSARLITITGAGGMGKTRLALESARRLAHVWPDGVRWVELGPLTSSTQAVQAVAQAIGLSTAGSELNPAAIWRFLETKRTLLILDNSEHLIEACAELANSLLDHCPAVHILATSREALRIPGEMIWELSTLTTPTAVTLKPEALFAHDAVQFFVDRVTLVRRDFVLGTHNARSVAEICQSMDGIPLALELAAGLTLGMSVQELATHLPHYLPLLTDGYRNPQHHRTMRNALAWSFEWLSAEQKRLLLNLSVFVGGFTASAAAAIHQNTLDEVIPLLLALVRKSLVLAATQDGETRYRLLEPIRQYTLEKVVSAGQLPGLRDHHLAYFASFAEQVDVGMMGSECGVWATRVQTDYNNLRAAREWSRTDDARQGRQGLELRLVGALWRYWLQVAQLREGYAWVQAALDREHAHPSLQPTPALCMGWLGSTATFVTTLPCLGWPSKDWHCARNWAMHMGQRCACCCCLCKHRSHLIIRLLMPCARKVCTPSKSSVMSSWRLMSCSRIVGHLWIKVITHTPSGN